jgi:tetratricopeptide (TPR) repeat protein
MAIDQYGPCPCGSGKKFKWCCQPIHVQVNKAFQQDADGQHEAALRTMDELTKEHADNPEAWGRKAQLLYENNRVDDAEKALDHAFELNPNYPFGFYLRGRFRHAEGELPGALLLFRKAVDRYDPEARDVLGHLHALIADCELKLNHAVAARVALQRATRLDPANESYLQGMDQLFGDDSRLPLPARREYAYLGLPADAPAERRAAWQQALGAAGTGKLSDAAAAFASLTAQDEQNAPAWYNLGLTRAWLGDNAGALDALDRYVGLEADETKAAEAWELGEVLRLGFGMEDKADYIEHAAAFPVRDPQPLLRVIEQLQQERLLALTILQEQEGVLGGMLLEPQPALTAELAARQPARLRGHLLLSLPGMFLRLWSLNREGLQGAIEEVRRRAGQALGEGHMQQVAAQFVEVFDNAMAVPLGATSQEEAQKRMAEGVERYFEEKWPHQPLRALGGVPPLDAAGHGTLRKKLRGVIAFLQDCAALGAVQYDFDRLRRKLGLLEAKPEAAASGPDVEAMGVAELGALAPESLADDQLEKAYQAALRLDARELAGGFGKALVARPPRAERPDRFPVFNQLVQQVLAEGDTAAALDYVNEGEKDDSEHNEGGRRNDYELRRAQIQVKRGEVDAAQEAFERLIARVPSELKYPGSAAEAMLAAKQGPRALRFAEQGLAGARRQNNRDSEQYFLELLDAAKRQGG